ncbi:MAG: bifunctional 4-hydroxy-2-oxoglutarate aldolase/2-dehydro-3-deoxy-phosphogluconate aldolase [Ignavibacteriaceae bacterium]
MSRTEILKKITDNGAVAVIRLADSSKLVKVAEAIYKGGVESIEITMTTPNALGVLEFCVKEFGNYMLFGVGSVLDADTVKAAVNVGAKYIVSPVFKKEIIDEAHRLNVPAMPGAFTPTEIFTAAEAGADVVKVFPADILGMSFFKSVKAPMPHLKMMPTGGVTLTNAGEWLKAGAVAVGVGSALLDSKAIAEGNFEQLTENAKILMTSIKSYKDKISGVK